MKNRLFYLIGTALLLCSTGTFTSCINGVDDEYLDQKNIGGGSAKDDESELPDLNGEYSETGDFELEMTYNGEKMGGKKVIVMADEKLETATFTLAGTEKDLSALSNLLEGMNAIITTNSPVPGEKEVMLKNVKLFRSGKDCLFSGEEIYPTYTLTYKGQILDDVMTIDITNKFTREENDLLGAWKMGAVKEAGSGVVPTDLLNNNDSDPTKSSPLFLDWNSTAKINMGNVPTGIDGLPTISVNRPMTGIFNLLMSQLVTSQLIKPSLEQALPKLIEYIVAEETGGMYASYSWNGAEDPQYSTEMSHNIIRYYFDKDNKLRLEADMDYLLGSLGGLLTRGSTGTITRAQPDNSRVLGKELVEKLKPALEQGFPCEYTIEGDNMTINIDGAYLLDVMKTVSKLLNDEFVQEFIYPELEKIEGVGQYLENIKNLIKNMPNALGDDCQYIKLGFRMVRMNPQPDVTE